MRIAITRRGNITELDGVNKFIFTLAEGLNQLGCEVHIISHALSGSQASNITSYAKKFFDFQGKIQIHTLPFPYTNDALTLPLWFLNGSKLINKLDADAVIINGIVPLNLHKVKIAVNHGIFTGSFFRVNRIMQRIYLQFVKYIYLYGIDLTVCVSSKLKEELKKLLNIKAVVIPLPLKLNLYRSEPFIKRSPLVLHVGGRSSKNAEISIKSVKILKEKYDLDVKLIVVGRKNAYLESLSVKYKYLVPKNLEFYFDASSLIVRDLMANAKALILPSRYEALPYVVLEAFASGLPVVVSNAIPSELVKDGYNGFRLYGYSPNSYAEKIKKLLVDGDLWSYVSTNALKTANEYSYIKIAKSYLHVLQTLCK